MHVDLNRAQAGAQFSSDICIVGGGIAGIILASRLAKRGIQVHLLEAGGLDMEPRSQALYRVEMLAEHHRGAGEGRFRTYGGSSTQWGGQILPFSADIFDPPEGLSAIAWPIQQEQIARYYREAEAILGVDDLPFSAELSAALHRPALPVSSDVIPRFSKWAPFQKRNLAHTVGAEALTQPGVTVFTHANAAHLSALPSKPGRIASARVQNYAREPFLFTARVFIVCAGTIESSRLLLCSPDVPNPHDQIGRYFHDHLSYHAARFPRPEGKRLLAHTGPFFVDGTTHSCKLEASPALRSRERLLAVMAHVVIVEPEDSGIAAVRNLLRALQQGNLRRAFGRNLLSVLRGSGDVVRLFIESRIHKRRVLSKHAELLLNIDVEQAPDAENRILLSREVDELGIPRAAVQWRVGDREKDSAARFSPIVREYLRQAGFTTLPCDPSLSEGAMPTLLDTYHAMGGLRMGEDPASSVVDSTLKVHGVDNLYVAGCAVFPSGGSSNPTFTLMALALRLADHLSARIEMSVAAGPSSRHLSADANRGADSLKA